MVPPVKYLRKFFSLKNEVCEKLAAEGIFYVFMFFKKGYPDWQGRGSVPEK